MEMTIEQAIRLIHPDTCEAALGEVEACDGMDFYESQIAVINKASLIAVECMEKQIPKKLVRGGMDRGAVMMVCPNCGHPLCSEYHLENSFYSGKHCGYCGQAVFWERD